MLKDRFSLSASEGVQRLATWVDQRPRWLRPAFYGAGLVYFFIVSRGGLIVLPLASLYLLFKDPALLIQKMLPALLLYAPGAGFLGGLLYGITEPILGHFGRAGKLLQYILGTWGYCIVLVFFIMPVIDPKDATSLSNTANWVTSAGMGLIFGLAIGIGATSSDTRPNPVAERRFVIGVVVVGAILIVAMKIAGWW